MKRTTLTTLMTTLLALAAFASNSHRASADTGDYIDGMKPFAPVIERWAVDARDLTAAALAKPELACSDEMAEMALRGFSIADDLDGMLAGAPKLLVLRHVQVAREVRVMASAAERACADAPGAASQTAESYGSFAGPMKQLRAYVNRAGRMIGR